MNAKTLIIHGAFAAKKLQEEFSRWDQAVVLEVDAYLPAGLRQACVEVCTLPPQLSNAEATALQQGIEEVLDEFLQPRVEVDALPTSRRFRAASLNIDAYRLLIAHVAMHAQLEALVRRHTGLWLEVIVSPGAGVSIRAAREIADKLAVPMRVLEESPASPPWWWMLKRRWQRARCRRGQTPSQPTPNLPPSTQCGQLWCCDPRLHGMLAQDRSAAGWVSSPAFETPEPSALQSRRAEYLHWWSQWMQDWRTQHDAPEWESRRQMLEDLGDWFCREVYPLHSLLLEKARRHLRLGQPSKVLIGSMRGRREMLWGLAAQDLGIGVAVYTVDCHIDSQRCFTPDVALCDDLRQWQIAQSQPAMQSRLIRRVKSHRQVRASALATGHARQRKRILMADCYYSGLVFGSMPLLSSWAIERVIEAARQFPQHDFVIKFHPIRERPEARFHHTGLHHLQLWHREQFIAELKPTSNLSLLPPEARLSEEITRADLLLNIQSYAALEAFELDLPVIHLQPLDEEGLYPLMRQKGLIQNTTSTDDLIRLIDLNLTDSSHRQLQIERQRQYASEFYFADAPSLAEAARDCSAPSSEVNSA
jgi:hypothetical protein